MRDPHAVTLAWVILAATTLACLTLLATAVRRAGRAIDHAVAQATHRSPAGPEADDWRRWEAEMPRHLRTRRTR